MSNIKIYTRDWCGFCSAAKSLLKSKNVTFKEFNASKKPEYRQEMIEKSKRNTFPQIFINSKHIGGCDDLMALERSGKLDKMLT